MITGMRAIRVAVIGAGFMGERHARIYAGLPDVELVAVCDVREDGRPRAGVSARVRPPTTRTSRSCSGGTTWTRSACARPTGSTASRASRPSREAATSWSRSRSRPRSTDAEAIVAAARRADAMLLVGHCLRFDPRYDQARQAVARGELGPLQTIYTRRANTVAAQDRLGGRCTLPLFLGVHDYDVMRWLTGSEVERVTAESKWGLLREQGFPVEDANCALIRFASGVLGVAELNWILPRGFPAAGDHRLDLVGSAGSLSIATLETGPASRGWPARGPGRHGVRAVRAGPPGRHVLLRAPPLHRLRPRAGDAGHRAGRCRAGPPHRPRGRARRGDGHGRRPLSPAPARAPHDRDDQDG